METLKKLLAMTALNTLRLFLADFRPGAQRVDTASGTGRARFPTGHRWHSGRCPPGQWPQQQLILLWSSGIRMRR